MKRTFIITKEFSYVTPATVLQCRLLNGGEVVEAYDIPEKTTVLKAGTVLTAYKKSDAEHYIAKYRGHIEETTVKGVKS